MTTSNRRGRVRPEIRSFLERQDLLELPAVWEVDLADARLGMVTSSQERWGAVDAVASVEDRLVPTRAGAIEARVYRSSDSPAPQPVFVYIHGGGWVVGDLDSHDGICRALANALNCTVVSPNYRLAPEHPFPAAVEDCVDAVHWTCTAGAGELGVDVTMLAVGGDSAGGNLSAVVARHMAARGVRLSAQVLIYPACDTDTSLPSFDECGDGFDLTSDAVRWFYRQYLADGALDHHPDRAPQHAVDVTGLAPAYIATAELDPVRDDGRAYAVKLRQAGVEVEYEEWPGTIHGFALMRSVTPATDELIARIAGFVTRHWAR
jgi:acetyl esterase